MKHKQTDEAVKVLVIVRGGVAEAYAEPKAEVCIIDYDNDPDAEIPSQYSHLLIEPSTS